MEIVIKAKALKVLEETAEHIDGLNTPGAGSRWLNNFLTRITVYTRPNVTYPLCKHHTLSARKFSCISFRKWVVAFKIQRNKLVIYEILHGALLY